MKLFNRFFKRKKDLTRYKDDDLKKINFKNQLSDMVPRSYNGLFSVIDSRNNTSVACIHKCLKDFSYIDEQNFELFYKSLDIDQEMILNYLDRESLGHQEVIEFIRIAKAREIMKLQQELDLTKLHIEKNEERIEKLERELEDYEEEHQQEALQEGMPANSEAEFIG
ncbi:hypothetical protein [Catenibacterium mitsuokai]|uniref:hypothetical protein n=1 Tax=Catenibacterium mitsuokai TaxID=100886 RepID=UPI002E793C7E|nr:hypothetical protein [Catenibacterium tridentinum]